LSLCLRGSQGSSGNSGFVETFNQDVCQKRGFDFGVNFQRFLLSSR
jgi:hypothetical protein